VTDVWEFHENDSIEAITAVALDRSRPPDWRGQLVATHGDVVTVQLVDGARPSMAESVRYYVEQRGPYRLLRREVWPAEPEPRVLLTLRAWPQRGVD